MKITLRRCSAREIFLLGDSATAVIFASTTLSYGTLSVSCFIRPVNNIDIHAPTDSCLGPEREAQITCLLLFTTNNNMRRLAYRAHLKSSGSVHAVSKP